MHNRITIVKTGYRLSNDFYKIGLLMKADGSLSKLLHSVTCKVMIECVYIFLSSKQLKRTN